MNSTTGTAAVTRAELLRVALDHFPSADTKIPPGSPVVVITISVVEYHRPRLVPLFGASEEARETRVDVDPPKPTARPVGCTGDIIQILQDVGKRLTADEIMAEMSRRGLTWSDAKVKSTLPVMAELGRLTTGVDVGARGYGLPADL